MGRHSRYATVASLVRTVLLVRGSALVGVVSRVVSCRKGDTQVSLYLPTQALSTLNMFSEYRARAEHWLLWAFGLVLSSSNGDEDVPI